MKPEPYQPLFRITIVIFVILTSLFLSSCVSPEIRAARRGDVQALEKYLLDGGDINAAQSNGKSLLHNGVESGQLSSTRFLLQNGANPDIQDRSGATPLHSAAQLGRRDLMGELLSFGANLNGRDNQLQNALFYAVRGDQFEAARFLILEGIDTGRTDSEGRTPLHLLARNTQVALAELLVSQGIDPLTTTTRTRETAIHTAAGQGAHRILEYFFTLVGPQIIDIPDGNGSTPVHRALDQRIRPEDSFRTLELLLNRGANPNRPDGRGTPPLVHAVEFLDLARVQLLLRRGADLNAVDAQGRSAYLVALGQSARLSSGLTPIAETLASLGAQWPRNREILQTHLFTAVTNGNTQVAERILSQGYSANLSRGDDTLLTLAVGGQRQAMVQLLLIRGAVTQTQNRQGDSPLHLAAGLPNGEITRLLILAGAQPNLRNRVGFTPLLVASAQGVADSVRHLLLAGADPNDLTPQGVSAYDLAADNPQGQRIRSLLLEAGATVTPEGPVTP